MKIAITSVGPSLDDQVEPRFGRAAYYIIVNTDTMEYEAIENPNVASGGGAGIQSAQLIAGRDVKFVLTGNCGPNAFNVFGTAGVQIIVGVTGTVLQAVEQFKSGAFSATTQPNVESYFGMGGDMGSGRGMGGGGMGSGRGMGGGRGARLIDASEGSISQSQMTTPEEEPATLEEQARMLQEQLKNIQEQIKKIDRKK